MNMTMHFYIVSVNINSSACIGVIISSNGEHVLTIMTILF